MESTDLDPARGRLELADRTVSTLHLRPEGARALFVFAHGAGTDMEHAFMTQLAGSLAGQGIATLRYNFPYSERGGGPPDRAPRLVTTVEAAARRGLELAEGLPVVIGGKSMGGRMSSTACAQGRVPTEVRGLVFVGFPLHRPRTPAIERAEHLAAVELPMLFLQGTRDRMAERDRLEHVLAALGERARVHWIEDADHGFHVAKRSGRSDGEIIDELAEVAAHFIDEVVTGKGRTTT